MKKSLLLFASACCGLLGYAQQTQVLQAPATLYSVSESPIQPQGIGTPAPTPAGAQVIWSEDFANGWPAGWTVDDQSGICPWVWSDDGSFGYFNGSNGASAGDAILSTTAANGFLICDPDSANHNTYGQPSGSTYQYLDSYFVTDAIDLSGYPAVNLEFEQFFRYNNTVDMEVMVSNDSSTWTTYTVQGASSNNTASDNPDYVQLNISAVAGDESTVWIKIGWSARVYYWMIDDMRITVAPDNDLSVEGVFYRGSSDTLYTAYYQEIPQRQAQQDSLVFAAQIENRGSKTQYNVGLNVDVTGPINYNQNSPTMDSLEVLEIDSFDIATPFYPGALGTYTVTFTSTSDSVDAEPDNNIFEQDFTVSDTVYARDNGNYQGNGIWYGAGTNYEAGNGFDILIQDTATSVSILFQGNTQPGSIVSINLYDGGNLNTPLASSPFVTLSASDIGAWKTFEIPNTALPPGFYIVTFATFSDSVLIATSPNALQTPPQSTFINVDNGGWFYTTSYTPFIRLNLVEFSNPCQASPSISTSSVSCNGSSDGVVDLNVNSPYTPITYNWSNGATTQDLTGVGGGTYLVTITDNIGCEYETQAIVAEPPVLASATSSTDENCGAGDGSATASASGGTSPYVFIWNTLEFSSTISGLEAGDYYVTISDGSGCSLVDTATVGGSGAILASTASTDAACLASDGDATVTPTTGTAPYTYAWNTGGTAQTETGLAAGSFTCTVTDSDGCASAIQVNVSNTGGPAPSAPSVTDVLCNGDANGSIDFSAFGGTSPYSYSWDNGDTTQMITGLAAGSYTGMVTDAAGCVLIQSFDIDEPNALTSAVTGVDPSCAGGSDGQATASVFGGTTSYTYNWTNGGTTNLATGLSAGTYTVTITDANGCTIVDQTTVFDPMAMSGTLAITQPLCNGDANGYASIVMSGGNFPYTYSWTDGSTTDQSTGLADGSYNVTVTDAAGCTVVETATVSEPDVISATGTVSDMEADYLGQIDLSVNGGTPGYSYVWTGPSNFSSNSGDLVGLTVKGTYDVTITDANGCTTTQTFNVQGNVSISEVELARSFNVFPNPNNGLFTVEVGNISSNAVLFIKNVLGQTVAVERLDGTSTHNVNIAAFGKGMYFVTLSDAGHEVSKRVVVQ